LQAGQDVPPRPPAVLPLDAGGICITIAFRATADLIRPPIIGGPSGQVSDIRVGARERLERQLARNPRLAEGIKQANLQVDGETIPSREELQTCPSGIFQERRQKRREIAHVLIPPL
jgi:hypothetical protein